MNQLVFVDGFVGELGCGSDTNVSEYNAVLKDRG